MNKIIEILTKLGYIPTDKLLHFIAGTLIASFFALVVPTCQAWCIAPVILAGIGKEVYDKISYGGFDWKDFSYTIVGGFIIQVFAWV